MRVSRKLKYWLSAILVVVSVFNGVSQDGGNELDKLYTPAENSPFSERVNRSGGGYHAKNYIRFKPFLLTRGIFATYYERTFADAIGLEFGLGTSFFPDYFMTTGIIAENMLNLNFVAETDYLVKSVPDIYAEGQFESAVSQPAISGLFLNAAIKFYYSGIIFDDLGMAFDFRYMRQNFVWREAREDELTESTFFRNHAMSFDHLNFNIVQSVFSTYSWGSVTMNHEFYYGIGARLYYYKPALFDNNNFGSERYVEQSTETARSVSFTYIMGYNIAFGWD